MKDTLVVLAGTGYLRGLQDTTTPLVVAVAGPLSAYLEFFSDVPTKDSEDWEGTADVGLMLTIGKNFQLDGGLNVGDVPDVVVRQPRCGCPGRRGCISP